jgi:hypothetical protein
MNIILSTIGVIVSMSIAGALGALVWPAAGVLFLLTMPYITPALGVAAVVGICIDRRRRTR